MYSVSTTRQPVLVFGRARFVKSRRWMWTGSSGKASETARSSLVAADRFTYRPNSAKVCGWRSVVASKGDAGKPFAVVEANLGKHR